MIAFACGLCLLSSCYREEALRGTYVMEEKIVKINDAPMDDVLHLLGSPTQISPYNENVWIYIGFKEKQFAFFDPKEFDRRVVRITFGKNKRVFQVEKLTKKEGKSFVYSRDKTPVYGNERGYIDQIIGNIGRFQAPQQ